MWEKKNHLLTAYCKQKWARPSRKHEEEGQQPWEMMSDNIIELRSTTFIQSAF